MKNYEVPDMPHYEHPDICGEGSVAWCVACERWRDECRCNDIEPETSEPFPSILQSAEDERRKIICRNAIPAK